MLESLTPDSFAPLVGATFRIDPGGGVEPIPVVLGEMVRSPRRGGFGPNGAPVREEPFSLVFLGPIRPVLPQRIYPLSHETLGRLELFLVPIGPEEGRMRYEAVFN